MNNSLKVNTIKPLRGRVELQSSPRLTNFLVSLSTLFSSKTRFEGDFDNEIIKDFIGDLTKLGVDISINNEVIKTSESYQITDSAFVHDLTVYDKFLAILVLALKGSVQIKQNKDFVDFLKYLGFVVDSKKDIYSIYNKLDNPRDSITFYNINVDYFLIAILSFCLNYDKFTIAISDTTYEINLLLEDLKKLGFVENIVYGNFVTITFNKDGLSEKLDSKVEVPRDPTEFLFFAFLALSTNGEIEIEGINPKYLANSLKILSELGAGYDSVDSEVIRIWGLPFEKMSNINISEGISYLEFTKLCLLTVITKISKINDTFSQVALDTNSYRTLIQDLNILGASLHTEEKYVYSNTHEKPKSGEILLQDSVEYQNYVRLLYALVSSEPVEIKNISALLFYNKNIVRKLDTLGANIVLN